MHSKRLVFAHIPKTAGTTVRRNIKDALELVVDDYTEIGIYDMTNWPNPLRYWVKPDDFHAYTLPENWSFIYGHIKIEDICKNRQIDMEDEDIVLLSFVRDPIDRLISTYNYISVHKSHPLHLACLESDFRNFFFKLSESGKNIQFNYLNCDRNLKWKFIVADSKMVSKTCMEAVKALTSRAVDAAIFDRKFNVTSKIPTEKDKLISRSDFSSEELEALYMMHDIDRKMHETVKAQGITFSNPAWEFKM